MKLRRKFQWNGFIRLFDIYINPITIALIIQLVYV